MHLPKHFSNWQGNVFQLRQLLLDIMTDRGSPVIKTVTVRYNDRPWFTSEIRKEIRIRDRLRKVMLKNHICKYKKQRNRINNLKKIAKENFRINLDNIILENASNNKTYWKIMKKLLKSNKDLVISPLFKT